MRTLFIMLTVASIVAVLLKAFVVDFGSYGLDSQSDL